MAMDLILPGDGDGDGGGGGGLDWPGLDWFGSEIGDIFLHLAQIWDMERLELIPVRYGPEVGLMLMIMILPIINVLATKDLPADK